jgi:multiple RNA-binding domain-containing protein 1
VLLQGVKDPPLPRPNKRRHLVSSSAEQSATSTRKKSVDTESPATTIKRENAKFEEFMEVMQSKPKRAVSWVDQADPFSSSSKKGKTPATQTLPILPEIKTQGYLTDMEWMQQRMKGGIEDIASPEVCFDQSDDEEQEEKISGDQLPTEETILSTGRLFVRNLTFTCTEEELRGLFQSFGLVSQVSETLPLGWMVSIHNEERWLKTGV